MSAFTLRRGVWRAAEQAALVAVLWFVMFPIVWMAITAFKTARDVYDLSIVFTPTLDNFLIIFQPPWNLGGKLLNSILIAGTTVVIAVPIATLAAYSFSRFDFLAKRGMFFLILATQFIPAVVIVLPFYLMFKDLGLLDTRLALIIVNLAIVTPFAVWMIKGYLDAIPVESEEAAMVDGASRLRLIWDIVVPMVLPGVLTAAVFCFILTWNEFIFALIITRDNAVTLPLGLVSFRTDRGDVWEYMAAAGLVTCLPIFIMALAIQRHFVRGLTAGAVR